jgi:alcohol dehydrogenase
VKAALLKRYGGNETLEIADIATPEIAEHEILVQVHAASVNPLDFKIRSGKLKALLRYRMPLVLGNDLAGVVVKTGARVQRFKTGDAVYARLDKNKIGAFAEYAAVQERDAALKPTNTTFEEAASLPLVALTAWQALVEIGKIKPGQRVLIHAGSGGVGHIAIQLAHHLGAEVLTTVGKRNFEFVRSLGADTPTDYRTERFEDIAKNCDVVLDSAGGETLVRSFKSVKPGGTVVSIGDTPSAEFAKEWGLNRILVAIIGLMARKVSAAAKKYRAHYRYLFMRADGAQLAQIAELVQAGILKPHIDKVFSLDDIKDAMAYSESGRATGKVVVKIN